MGLTRVRYATAEDAAKVLEFNRKLAMDEGLGDVVTATVERYRTQIFERRQAEVIIVSDETESNVTAAGCALFYPDYSSISGCNGMHLKSLYVRPEFRRRGYARIAMSRLARIAVKLGWDHINWLCLEQNLPAMRFYESLGAGLMEEAVAYRLSDDKVAAMVPPTGQRTDAAFSKRWKGLSLRKATSRDAAALCGLIMDFSRHEKIQDWMKISPENMCNQIFVKGGAEVIFGECRGIIVGAIIFYPCFDTFTGKPGLHVEGLFIKPEFRSRGYGRAFLEKLAIICKERGFGHIEWMGVAGNMHSRGFSGAIGAELLEGARYFVLEGNPLLELAGQTSQS